MSMEECRHGKNAPQKMLVGLPESQGGLGRHRCANCAYQLGITEQEDMIESYGKIIQCSHGNHAPEKLILVLGESQGGSGRHKCVICAYQEGRAAARGLSLEDAWIPKGHEQRGSITATKRPAGPTAQHDEDWWKKEHERNKEIGDIGERLVLEYEKTFLISSDRHDLANRVTHVSKVEGDHIGYDIRSYNNDGSVKYIEVKTTTGGIDTPFYMSENERLFSVANGDKYYLYRLHGLDEDEEKAKFYAVAGGIQENFELFPVSYQVILKGD